MHETRVTVWGLKAAAKIPLPLTCTCYFITEILEFDLVLCSLHLILTQYWIEGCIKASCQYVLQSSWAGQSVTLSTCFLNHPLLQSTTPMLTPPEARVSPVVFCPLLLAVYHREERHPARYLIDAGAHTSATCQDDLPERFLSQEKTSLQEELLPRLFLAVSQLMLMPAGPVC